MPDSPPVHPAFAPFPPGFLWGVASSAFQIEGAAAEDGRTPSVWDTFCRRRGVIKTRPEPSPGSRGLRRIRDLYRNLGTRPFDHTATLACDHYHRYREDVALMRSLGIQAYRFSTSWSRIIPARGTVNEKGLDFYDRVVDALLSAGIQPWLTLFHWDLPQWCEDRYRGWESPDCAADFADYAALVARRLGDRLQGLFTVNEIFCYTDKAYTASSERFAPAKLVSRRVLAQVRHHAIYAHGLGVQAARAHCKAAVGLAENIPCCTPIIETEANVAAARCALRELAGMFLTPIMEGQYPATYLEDMGADAPVFTDAQMRTIATPLDCLGLNQYFPYFVRADPGAKRGWSALACDEGYPKMQFPWLNIAPSILYWGARLCHDLWRPRIPAIYITENGCADTDRLTEQREVHDLGRIMFLQNHLLHLQRACAEGLPVKGYFLWSLMDNFEWACGYTKRLGLCYVDYDTMERIPKLSAGFYARVIRGNAVGG